ncbi:MAG: helix-turn-helix domain-containing protein [Clostridia bacterium]|nr:helix-turn-helix domain-containing protein [Clostridia bacterium]
MNYQCFENLLKMHKITAYRVSKDTGISPSTLADWKYGRTVPKADKLQKIAEYFDVGINYFFDSGSPITAKRGTQIPIIGEIRAGSPIITEETLLGYEIADVDDSNDFFFLTIRGDSMKNIGMIDGSLVLFKKQQYAENGDIVACLVGGDSATVKRFSKDKKGVRLIPENEDYSPILLAPEDFESGDARILGIATEIKIKL